MQLDRRNTQIYDIPDCRRIELKKRKCHSVIYTRFTRGETEVKTS